MKKIGALFVLFLITFVFCFVSCKKTKAKGDSEAVVAEQVKSEASSDVSVEPEVAKDYTPITVNLDVSSDNQAHQKFLDDPMIFSSLPNQGISEGETAVVGSRVCMLYPKESFSFTKSDTATIIDEQNMGGIPVPISSILKITGGRLLNGKEDLNDYVMRMFNFQDNWNWFYPAEWNGNVGYVYGADLFGLNNSIESNRISAELYRTNGVFTEFYPIAGYTPLSEKVSSTMKKQKIAFQNTTPDERPYPDDMIESYTTLDKNISMFVTTDLIAHSQHLIFDRMLQYTEEFYFEPRLASLTKKCIELLSSNTNCSDEVKQKAIEYFQVPEALLAMAPERVKDTSDYREQIVYQPKDTSTLLNSYSEPVRSEIQNVMNASGNISSIFGTKEDFTQYKPRGHYTKNGILEAYFRAEMWYGRIHFLIAQSTIDKEVEEDSLKMMPVALFIIDTFKKNPELYEQWSVLFDPITDLIGLSDDLGFTEVMPLWKDQNVTDFAAWASNKENLLAFMELCHQKLRSPAISGNSVFLGPSEDGEERNPPMGWRFMGQRFTYDSYIHNTVSAPRLMSRDFVRGLDIMKVFGSKSADAFLASSDYPVMSGLEETLDGLEEQFAGYGKDFWNKTYYNQVLYQIKTMATFEQGAGFYFTETPAWNNKAQLSAHGTWAELRHDTILYVKQSYAERAGDGDFDPTFRTEPLPKPINYIEPNMEFWKASLFSVQNLQSIYNKYNLLDYETKDVLDNLQSIYMKSFEIVRKEVADEPISAEENKWIQTIPKNLSQLVLVHVPPESYASDYDQFKMACIADVFTNAEFGQCIETGVGVPYRLYVPLNDSQGGKRIAVGFGFTYYEFNQPQNQRLTDEAWKEIVYKKSNEELSGYMPFWEKSCFIAADNTFEH